MPTSDEFKLPPDPERLSEILIKIVMYQHSLPDGRAVELEELDRKGILSREDLAFLSEHSVTYKPHRISDYHTLDMFHMPTSDGGCIFTGPSGPSLKKRSVPLSSFQVVIEEFLKLPRPQDELLLHIEFTEQDGMGVSPHFVSFTLKNDSWRKRLVSIRGTAASLGWRVHQDEEIQGNHNLSFNTISNAAQTAADAVALLKHGCKLTDEDSVVYSAGALDELDGQG